MSRQNGEMPPKFEQPHRYSADRQARFALRVRELLSSMGQDPRQAAWPVHVVRPSRWIGGVTIDIPDEPRRRWTVEPEPRRGWQIEHFTERGQLRGQLPRERTLLVLDDARYMIPGFGQQFAETSEGVLYVPASGLYQIDKTMPVRLPALHEQLQALVPPAPPAEVSGA